MSVMNKPSRNRLVKRSYRSHKPVTAFSGSRAKTDENKTKVRGAEVSIRQAAAPGQIIYGKMKVGGIYTFLETSNQTQAFMRTGEDNAQIVWQAKPLGEEGNNISVTMYVTGTFASNSITVSGTAITIRLRSSGSAVLATASEVIAAVNASASASALVFCHQGEGTGASIVEPIDETFLSNGGGQTLHSVLTIAAHEITSIDKLFLNNRQVAFGAPGDSRWSTGYFVRNTSTGAPRRLVFMDYKKGTETQTAIASLVANRPSTWTSNHRQRGCAHAYIQLIWDETKFAQGRPDIAFLVSGKPVYDPRYDTTGYSTNAALIIADYLTNTKWGLGVSWADIDTDALIEAAQDCDDLIPLAGGGSEKRYQIKGVFDASESPQQVLQEMADAIAGDIVYQGGKWRILPGKWREPWVTLSRGDTRGQVTVSTRRGRHETFNCIRGTFSSEDHDYQEIEFPTIKVPTYITEDGREIYKDISLNFVTKATQAQRIAKIRLAQIRQPIVVEASFTIKALSLQIGDVVLYNDDVCGWVEKPFEVRSFALEESGDMGLLCRVTLAETAEAIYTWTTADELAVDPAPNTNFPSASDIDPPTGLTLSSGTSDLYLREDGTVFSRLKVSWTLSPTVYVEQGGRYEVQYKKSSDSTWNAATSVPSELNYLYILDVQDGQAYDVRVRARSALRVPSEWVTQTNYTIIGKTEPPSTVTTFGSVVDSFGIALEWTPVSDIDVREYEIRLGAGSWASAAFIHRGTGKTHRTTIKTAGTYTFQIRAVDTSGNFSVSSTTTVVTISAPDAPLISSAIEGTDVRLSWGPPAGQFAVDYYQISYGDTFAGSTVVGTVKGTTYRKLVDWGGSRKWWIAAVDIAGNIGGGGFTVVTIASPGIVSALSSEVIDSYVKLDWDAPATGTLPVAYYKVLKGADFFTASLVGQVSATFAFLFETIGGTFTYWVVAVDTAGNQGLQTSAPANLNNPPDLTIAADTPVTLSLMTLANMTLVDGKLLGPVNTGETWDSHFTSNGFTSPQAQVDAGYPLYPQPGPSWCGAQIVHDFGAMLPVGFIKATVGKTLLSGTPTVTTTLWYSADNITWTGGTGGDTISAAASFRYVKVRLSYGTVPPGTFP